MKSFMRPLFPGFYKALTLSDKTAIELVNKRLSQNKPYMAFFMSRKNDETLHTSGSAEPVQNPLSVHDVGSLCQIHNALPGPNETLTLLLYPHRRVSMRKDVKPVASTTIVEDFVSDFADKLPDKTSEAIPMIQETLDTLMEISNLNPLLKDQMSEFMRTLKITGTSMFNASNFKDSLPKLADFAVSMCDAEPDVLQRIMSEPDVLKRMEETNILLQKELINAELQSEIRKDTDKQVSERDRSAFLKSKLRSIQRELGLELVAKEKMIERFQGRCEKLKLPEATKKVFDAEIGKLSHLRPSSQEYNLTTNYLDWLTQVPWGKFSDENLDVLKAEKVLNEDHYGMKDVKERILEFVAVANMKGGHQGKIICLNGPPGVGKTSIGKSISRALNREFHRFSVGGLYDVAEIRGHRRTYVGAMPGKLVQALKSVQTQNPVILIDEIDKIGQGGSSGDPTAALLEVLDPEQNSTFVDHYLDLSLDLSKVLFVCTANVLETIPGPLLDRMEVINLSGYVSEEKKEIAKQYLIPRAKEQSGLDKYPVTIDQSALDELIVHYCRESGVRNLKKQIERIFRKAALKVVEASDVQQEQQQEQQPQEITITQTNLKEFVGKPIFTSARLFNDPGVGVIMGLAYNSYGGTTLFIECVAEPIKKPKRKSTSLDDDEDDDITSTGKFKQTGNMGDVMKESSHIAYSYARAYLRSTANKPAAVDFLNSSAVHLHVPEGATPKDGPSAGVAMCAALISLATNRTPIIDAAMTGELTLTGRVLRIGGLKEKVMAAKRAGVPHVIIPHDNRADFESFDEHVRHGVQPHFVKTFDEVFKLLFPQ